MDENCPSRLDNHRFAACFDTAARTVVMERDGFVEVFWANNRQAGTLKFVGLNLAWFPMADKPETTCKADRQLAR
jgi:hypothetical protein